MGKVLFYLKRWGGAREHLAAYPPFVDGPVLVLPMAGETNFSFNPNELVPLPGHGTVYTTLRVADSWGILDVSNGALMSFEAGGIRVEAPTSIGTLSLAGPGWTLELGEGWTAAPGPRAGDHSLVAHPSATPRR